MWGGGEGSNRVSWAGAWLCQFVAGERKCALCKSSLRAPGRREGARLPLLQAAGQGTHLAKPHSPAESRSTGWGGWVGGEERSSEQGPTCDCQVLHLQAPNRVPGTKGGLAPGNQQGCPELSHHVVSFRPHGAGPKNSPTAYPKAHYKYENSIFNYYFLYFSFLFHFFFLPFSSLYSFIFPISLFPFLFYFSSLFSSSCFYFTIFSLPSYYFFLLFLSLVIYYSFFLFLFFYGCCCCCCILSCSMSICTVICITWVGLSLTFSKPEGRAHP